MTIWPCHIYYLMQKEYQLASWVWSSIYQQRFPCISFLLNFIQPSIFAEINQYLSPTVHLIIGRDISFRNAVIVRDDLLNREESGQNQYLMSVCIWNFNQNMQQIQLKRSVLSKKRKKTVSDNHLSLLNRAERKHLAFL